MKLKTSAAALLTLALAGPAMALMPLLKPTPNADVDPGLSASYAGRWSMSVPTMDVGSSDTVYAICDLPVRIEKADETHIFYLGPRDLEAQAAMELQKQEGGALWAPIAGGPSFFAVFVTPDLFYLYDRVPLDDAEWGQPFVYRRCP